MPYSNDAPGDVDFATNRANDPTKSISSRAGVTITEKDAIEELRARRSSAPTPAPSVSTSLTPQATSSDDAEKAALNQLRQRRTQSPQQTSTLEQPSNFSERFNAAPTSPYDTAKQMIAEKGFGGAITPFFQSQLQRLVQENPGAATTMAVGMNLPLIAAGTYYGGIGARYAAPFVMRNLERIGLGGLGLEQIVQHGPSLWHLIRGN